jgi:hypothetical protein
MTLDEATKAAKHGAIAAFISGTLTAVIVGLALTMDNPGEIAAWNDPLNIFDVVLLFGLAIGMLRKSRAAAVIAFIYFILAKVFIALETGAGAGVFGGIVFLYFFGRAIQGTFTYHRIRKAEDEDYRAAPKWSFFVGIPLAVILFAAMGIGILSMTDIVPSTEVLPGGEVSAADVSLLVENEILFADEEIEYFYSYGLVSVLEGGDILTDRAVITYYQDENDDLQIYSMNFDEITAVFRMEEGGALTDALYKVTSDDEDDWIIIELSTEKGGDLIFVDALRQKIRQAKETSQQDTE